MARNSIPRTGDVMSGLVMRSVVIRADAALLYATPFSLRVSACALYRGARRHAMRAMREAARV